MIGTMRKTLCICGTIMILLGGLNSQVRNNAGPSDLPLVQAIWEHNVDRAREIIRSRPNLNIRDRFGDTPLAEAIAYGLSDLAEELVAAGADPNFAEGKGISQLTFPLMQAALRCDTRTARLLLDHAAVLDAVDADGETALMYASETCQDSKMLVLLIRAGANVNARDKLGTTPLMHAAFSGNDSVIRELLRAGADLTAKDHKGKTAAEIACEWKGAGNTDARKRSCVLLRTATDDDK